MTHKRKFFIGVLLFAFLLFIASGCTVTTLKVNPETSEFELQRITFATDHKIGSVVLTNGPVVLYLVGYASQNDSEALTKVAAKEVGDRLLPGSSLLPIVNKKQGDK